MSLGLAPRFRLIKAFRDSKDRRNPRNIYIKGSIDSHASSKLKCISVLIFCSLSSKKFRSLHHRYRYCEYQNKRNIQAFQGTKGARTKHHPYPKCHSKSEAINKLVLVRMSQYIFACAEVYEEDRLTSEHDAHNVRPLYLCEQLIQSISMMRPFYGKPIILLSRSTLTAKQSSNWYDCLDIVQVPKMVF